VIAGSEYRNVHGGTGIEQYYWLPEDREAGPCQAFANQNSSTEQYGLSIG
jgi:hypothetical protein